jgi:steroid 5-alpha reductase family enzyme
MAGFDLVALGVTFGVTIAAFTLLWVVSLRINDAGIVDYYWALGFAVIGWLTLAMTGQPTIAALIVLSAITLWAVRLTTYLVIRHARMPGEDPRYAKFRAEGGPNFKRRSLVTIFWLQGALLWLTATPAHLAGSADLSQTNALFWLGMAIFAAGFVIEAAADYALLAFKADPANRGRLLTTGLFAWSRHPNYFGEILVWWGLGLAVAASSGAWLALFGPALLTLVLVKVSGPPMQVAALNKRPGYEEWAATTPLIFPRPPRRRRRAMQPAE